ncbi:MAG: DUF1295 domain-containing protein [Acidobacteriota bacterium]
MLTSLAVLLAAFSLVWILSLRLRDASIADIWWGPSFVVASTVYLAVSDGDPLRRTAVVSAVLLWAARLAWHIGARHQGEDARYRAWRDQHGARWWWFSYFKVFVLQGVIAWAVSWPLFVAIAAGAPPFPTAWDVAGLALFAVGLAFEAVADLQLRRFRADPARRGTVLDTGLWRYSRHPNYFGEAVLWWGLGLVAAGVPGGWPALVSPLLLTFLLLRVSGVTLLEAGLSSRKPGYRDYVARTSAFVPWPPRRRREPMR